MNQIATLIEWPPVYSIKKHPKARSVKLRASRPQGLEITVPMRFNVKEIPAILEEHKVWITKQLLQAQAKFSDALPVKVDIKSSNECWAVHYVECSAKLDIVQRPHQEIVLVGNIQDKDLCKDKLINWIKQKAKSYLMMQLQVMSELTQLPYSGLTIRDQQTVWGSCTSSKSINLNYKLIFLPLHLVNHVLVHELCHTRHLNHSDKFWGLVGEFDKDWQVNRRELRRADQHVPGWLR